MQAPAEAGPPPPPDLTACPPTALEACAHARAEFAAALQQRLAARLGPKHAAIVDEVIAQLLAEGIRGGPSSSSGDRAAQRALTTPPGGPAAPAEGLAPALALRFSHDCRHPGCADAQCLLCEQSPGRRCSRTFCQKYLTGDPLRAACGAPIRVELVDHVTGRRVQEHSPLLLQLSVLDGRTYEELAAAAAAAGATPAEADLEGIVLLQNQQGKPLLTCKQGGADDGGRVAVELSGGSALLPDICVTGSSEALLSGQRPPFALLVQALQGGQAAGAAAGQRRRADVPPVVSECFVVATPRVRSAAKRDVPLLTDHVSKLNCVGAATQAKLRDLKKAAADAGERGLQLPLTAVTTVAEFRELSQWAGADGGRLDRVKRLLKLTRGWEEARDHAMRAVGCDTRLRVFYADDARSRGLLFAARDASPLTDAPLAVLEAAVSPEGAPTLRATLLPPGGCEPRSVEGGGGGAGTSSGLDGQQVAALLQQAKACWGRRGHPGWALLALDTAAFQQGCSHLPSVLLPTSLAAAAVPQVPHSGPAFPLPAPTAAAAAGAALPAGQPMTPSPALSGPARQQQQQVKPEGRQTAAASAGAGASVGAGPAAGTLAHKLALSLSSQGAGRCSPAPMQLSDTSAGGALALTPAGSEGAGFPPLQPTAPAAALPDTRHALEERAASASPPLFVFGGAGSGEPPTPTLSGAPAAPVGRQLPHLGAPAVDTSGALARILSSLPSLPAFGPEGPLGLPAIAELDLAAGLQPEARPLARSPSLGGLSDSSVDWKQLLREAYTASGGGTPLVPSGRATPQPGDDAGPASGRTTPPLTGPAAAPAGAAAAAAGASAAAAAVAAGATGVGGPAAGGSGGSQLSGALLKMLSGSGLSRLGTLASMDWEGLLSEGSLEALLGPPPGGEGAGEGGGARRRPGSPEWSRLLGSMGPADWAALLQEHQAAVGAVGVGEVAAAGPAAQPAAGAEPAAMDGVALPPPPPKVARKRPLAASTPGGEGGGGGGSVQSMDGMEVETPGRRV